MINNKGIPTIKKTVQGEDASKFGAFPTGTRLTFRITMPRNFASSAPVLRICPDGGSDTDIASSFVSGDGISDIFEVTVCPSELLGKEDGLLYYTFLFPNGADTRFTSSVNNVDFELEAHDGYRFRLLIYRNDFTVPKWIDGKVMYHIFVDRFLRGSGEVSYRKDDVIDEDWKNGIPQYGERAGAYVENNVFFGGNLWGIAEKLDYLKSLNIGVIYLSPIFEARSNHKYDIGNYLKIDGGFGGETAFDNLLKKASECGIQVILDGVFNHTGDDSLYFDRYGNYGGKGAYGDPSSEYRDWYSFRDDGEYDCWWGVKILPRLNQNNEECRKFFTSYDGVGAYYIRKGIAGWRLDVADELSDSFLDEFRSSVKSASNGNAIVIGEVWENAADKISYGKRRRYLRGLQLDSVMNYPLRNGIIAFAGEEGNAEALYDALTELYGSYPRCVCDALMNIVGTHDTERILTVLGGEPDAGYDNAKLASMKMAAEERRIAVKRLKIASVIQYTVFGFPSVYYGDEAGLEGYHDPFCRKPFPWGHEDAEILGHYKLLGEIRSRHGAFAGGDFSFIDHDEKYVIYERKKGCDRVITAANRSCETLEIALPGHYSDALTGKHFRDFLTLEPDTAVILEEVKD